MNSCKKKSIKIVNKDTLIDTHLTLTSPQITRGGNN